MHAAAELKCLRNATRNLEKNHKTGFVENENEIECISRVTALGMRRCIHFRCIAAGLDNGILAYLNLTCSDCRRKYNLECGYF